MQLENKEQSSLLNFLILKDWGVYANIFEQPYIALTLSSLSRKESAFTVNKTTEANDSHIFIQRNILALVLISLILNV